MSGPLKHIKDHMRAIKNIQKITGSMKMIAATKFLRAEKNVIIARPMGLSIRHFYKLNPIAFDKKAFIIHLCPVTTDRGLCGPMITKICKISRNLLSERGVKHQLVCIGEKTKLNFAFDMKELLCLSVYGVGLKIPVFKDGSRIADYVLNNIGFTYGRIVFGNYLSITSFNVIDIPIFSYKLLNNVAELHKYSTDEFFPAFIEFTAAAEFYYALSETYSVELANRINAMTSASKAAKEMGKHLSHQYNRRRQSAVTKELIDIISGSEILRK